MTSIYDYLKPKFNMTPLFLGAMGLVFGMYATLYGIDKLNSYMLFGLLMTLYFIYETASTDRTILSWGLWLSFLGSQLFYTISTGNTDLTFVAGLCLVNFAYLLIEKKAVFKALLVLMILLVVPIQFGGLIAGLSLFLIFPFLVKEDPLTAYIVMAYGLSACYNDGAFVEGVICLLPAVALGQYTNMKVVKGTLVEVIAGLIMPQFLIVFVVYLALNMGN